MCICRGMGLPCNFNFWNKVVMQNIPFPYCSHFLGFSHIRKYLKLPFLVSYYFSSLQIYLEMIFLSSSPTSLYKVFLISRSTQYITNDSMKSGYFKINFTNKGQYIICRTEYRIDQTVINSKLMYLNFVYWWRK